MHVPRSYEPVAPNSVHVPVDSHMRTGPHTYAFLPRRTRGDGRGPSLADGHPACAKLGEKLFEGCGRAQRRECVAEVGRRRERHPRVSAGIIGCLLKVVCAHRGGGIFYDAEDVVYGRDLVVHWVNTSMIQMGTEEPTVHGERTHGTLDGDLKARDRAHDGTEGLHLEQPSALVYAL